MKECQQEWKPRCRKRWESSSGVLFRDSGAEVMLCNMRHLCWHQTVDNSIGRLGHMGRHLAAKNAWIRIWPGHQPVQQDIYNGTNSSKTRDDNQMTLLIQNQVKIYYEHLGFCFDLSPVWHQPCSVMSLVFFFLLFYLHSAESDLSHGNVHTHTLTRTGPALTDATSPLGLFVQRGLIRTTVSASVFLQSKICPCHSPVC